MLTTLPLAVSAEAKGHPSSIQRLQRLFSQLAQTGKSSSIESEYHPAIKVHTSDTYGNRQTWDAVTEIDDCPQDLCRFSWTGLDPRVTTPPNSLGVGPSDFISEEELNCSFAEELGIQNTQSTVDGQDPTSNEKTESHASKVESKTLNEVYVHQSLS